MIRKYQVANLFVQLTVLFTILLMCIQAQDVDFKIDHDIPDPKMKQAVFKPQNISAKDTQIVKIDLPTRRYLVGATVYQKIQNQNGLTIYQDYKANQNSFEPSSSCQIVDHDISVTELHSTKIQVEKRSIVDFLLDKNAQIVYLRTTAHRFEAYKIVQDGVKTKFNFQGTSDFPTVFHKRDLVALFMLDKIPCLTNGKQVFKFEIENSDPQNPKLQEILIDELNTGMQGDPSKKQGEFRSIKVVNDTLLIVYDTYYAIHSFDKQTQKFTLIADSYEDTVLRSNLNVGEFVDVAWDQTYPKHLYLLTNTQGIIQIRDFWANYAQGQYLVVKHEDIKELGEAQSFFRFEDVFEISFKFNKIGKRYLAEFLYKDVPLQEGLTEGRFILNRFYDKVHEVKDIEYSDGELVILGTRQFHIYGPGVNRKILDKDGMMEFPYIGANFGIKQFSVLNKRIMEQPAKILGIKGNEITLLQIDKKNPYIQCRFDRSTQLLIKSIGTCDYDVTIFYQKTSVIDIACQNIELYQINVINEFDTTEALMVTIGLITVVICLAGACNLSCLAQAVQIRRQVAKWKDKLEGLRKKRGSKISSGEVDANSIQQIASIGEPNPKMEKQKQND